MSNFLDRIGECSSRGLRLHSQPLWIICCSWSRISWGASKRLDSVVYNIMFTDVEAWNRDLYDLGALWFVYRCFFCGFCLASVSGVWTIHCKIHSTADMAICLLIKLDMLWTCYANLCFCTKECTSLIENLCIHTFSPLSGQRKTRNSCLLGSWSQHDGANFSIPVRWCGNQCRFDNLLHTMTEDVYKTNLSEIFLTALSIQ